MKYIFFIMYMLVDSVFAKTNEQPNILWITSEDNNINWVGCYNNKWVDTPNIDQLAKEGFRYTEVYANAPVCAPSRSTWITGMYAVTTGTQPMRSRNHIPHDIISYYPDILKSNGYFVGNDNKTDYNIGGREDRLCWDNPKKINWEELKNNEPFFQVVNFYESHESRTQGELINIEHDPNEVTLREYHPDLQDIRRNYAKYHDAIKRMDKKVGEVLSQLKDNGLDKKTIVIYNSDHGGVLPRSKRYLYNSGLHCPLIIRIPEMYKSVWPQSKPGTTVSRLVSFIDMPKTWLSLAGIEVPNIYQGNIFLGQQKESEASYHYAFRGRMDERIDCSRAIHNKRFLYVRNYMPYVPWVQHLEYQWKIPAMRIWEDFVKKGEATEIQARPFSPKSYSEELYDMKSDPDSVINLIHDKKYTKIVDEFRLALNEWQIKIRDTGLLPESERTRISVDTNLTIYEWAADNKYYPIEQLLNAANKALEQTEKNRSALRKLTHSELLGERYWGVIGLFLIKDDFNARKLIEDESHEIRAMAAWNLIQNKNKELGFRVLRSLIENNSYAELSVLNILDWIGHDARILKDCIKGKDYESDPNLQKMKKYLIKKWI